MKVGMKFQTIVCCLMMHWNYFLVMILTMSQIQKNMNDRQRFQYALLHPKYGLCVYIFNPVGTVGGGYIILRSDDVDLSSFLNELSMDIS